MTTEVSVDRYGFRSSSIERPRSKSIIRENARLEKWQDMLYRWEYNKLRRPDFIKKRIRKGIPDSLRGRVWYELAGLKTLKQDNLYENLVNTDAESKAIEQIMLDIDRTFPDHILFGSAGQGQQSLFRVLKAYSMYDPLVGYCQGMGFLSALFLIYLPEEDAF